MTSFTESRGSHFSEEHQAFRKTVRAFVEREMKPHVESWEDAGIFPRELFLKMAGEDLLGLSVDPKWGGLGLDYWYTVAFMEELVRSEAAGVNMGIMVQTDIATPVVASLGSDEQKAEFLAPAVRGEKIAALGISEPDAGSDVFSIKTKARVEGDDYVISGSKTFITNGTRADFIVLLVRTDSSKGHRGGFSLLTFPTHVPGFSVGRSLAKMGNLSSDTAELFFEDCRIPRRYVLGKEGEGFIYLMKHFQRERLVASISATALSAYWLEQTLAYARERKAFGQPLQSFQVWKHQFAELSTRIEAARRLAYHAVDLFNRGEECTREVSMAKLFCCETANHVVDRCVQLHGGWGYMDEYPISRAFRDTRLLTLGAGTSEVMKEIIAKLEGYGS